MGTSLPRLEPLAPQRGLCWPRGRPAQGAPAGKTRSAASRPASGARLSSLGENGKAYFVTYLFTPDILSLLPTPTKPISSF